MAFDDPNAVSPTTDATGATPVAAPVAATPDAAAPAAAPDAPAPVLSGDSTQPAQQPTASPIQGDLQQPQAAAPAPSGITPAGQGLKAQGGFFKNMSHAFAGAVLSSLAGGHDRVDYKVDDNPDSPTFGKTQTIKTPRTRGDMIAAIARNALAGLVAAENAPSQPGGELAAGIAGGAAGAMNFNAQQDAQKREEASAEFQQQQKADASKGIKARNTLAMFNDWQDARSKFLNQDPTYQTNLSVFKAVTDPDYAIPGVRVVNDQQLQALAQSNHDWIHQYIPLNLGPKLTDIDAKTGQPKAEGQIALIPQDGAGQILIPAALATDIQKYGKRYITGADQLTAGKPVAANRLPAILAAVATGRVDARKADEKPNLIIPQGRENKGASLVRQNSVTLEQTPASAEEQLKYDNDLLTQKKTKIDIEAKQQEIDNLRKLGVTVPANAALPENRYEMDENSLRQSLTGQGIQIPANFSTLYSLGHYDADPSTFSTAPRKGTGQISKADAINMVRTLINPTYDDKNYAVVKQLDKEFASTKSGAGASLDAFNTGTSHLYQLWTAATALQNGNNQLLNQIANIYGVKIEGQSAPVVFNSIRSALAGEIGKTFKGGAADIPERESIEQSITNASSPQQAQDVAKTYAHLMLSKADTLADHYIALTGKRPKYFFTHNAEDAYRAMGIDTGSAAAATVPSGMVRVQLNGTSGFIPKENAAAFKLKYPTATVVTQ